MLHALADPSPLEMMRIIATLALIGALVPVATRSVELKRDDAGRVAGLSVYIDERSRDIRFTRVR